MCNNCDKIVVDIVKNHYYNLLGDKLRTLLQTRKILFFGVNEVMRRLLDFISECDFAVTAPDLKFDADDWRVIESELYDKNVMSDMIENKFISKLSSENLNDIGMVVVLSVNLLETAKQKVRALMPKLPVLMYSDVLHQV